jgi:hypothetical protein
MKKFALLFVGALLITSLAGCGQPVQEEQDEFVTSTVNTPNLPPVANDCAKACSNYVRKCLTLVPNANQALFQEGQESCEQECASWNEEKIQCMINAPICEDMTYVCGL